MAVARRTLVALLATVCIAISSAAAATSVNTTDFVGCLAVHLPPGIVYTQSSESYPSVLEFSIKNLRFVTPATPTPLVIVKATHATHGCAGSLQSLLSYTVRCGAAHGVRVRPRSGGHDYEGLSYRSLDAARPFAVVDLAALRAIRVDVRSRSAWVESGATLGELYYGIANKSARLGFPAGVGPTVGVGGHLSGGGFGLMLRKHGLAADHVVDAVMDHFWAIRGGGGGSFGIVVSWKLRLVRVPATVTVFTVHRPRNQSASDLLTKWQHVAPALPRDIILRVSLYLGRCTSVVATMSKMFPELGVTRRDCIEMSWIESVLYFAFYGAGKLLLDRGTKPDRYFKGKSDFVHETIPRDYYGFWWDNTTEASEQHMGWVSGLHREMEPYVSKSPRGAYVNYKDLDLGVNEYGGDGAGTNYEKARAWGEAYFKDNFERLAAVKAKVDPSDFFSNEQSIPPLRLSGGNGTTRN
ncbi:hypothetical protein VPH35_130458 [Triticum aestivum]